MLIVRYITFPLPPVRRLTLLTTIAFRGDSLVNMLLLCCMYNHFSTQWTVGEHIECVHMINDPLGRAGSDDINSLCFL